MRTETYCCDHCGSKAEYGEMFMLKASITVHDPEKRSGRPDAEEFGPAAFGGRDYCSLTCLSKALALGAETIAEAMFSSRPGRKV